LPGRLLARRATLWCAKKPAKFGDAPVALSFFLALRPTTQ
jgi:hypothetical protein